MSITTAFAMGYDQKFCASSCQLTATNPYFNSASELPFDDFHIRPTMMLAARSFPLAKALIDRGIAADENMQSGNAYLVETSDSIRSARKILFAEALRRHSNRLTIHREKIDQVTRASDVMFYFTGATKIGGLSTNRYLPGAVGDHLTSFGGQLTDSSQMSALQWLEAGTTGSYGTVVEPCAFLEKFPNPNVMMQFYLEGQTLIEAYWKSVQMPGQGVFIGEPLARPYATYRISREQGKWIVRGGSLRPGVYQLWASNELNQPFTRVSSMISISAFAQSFVLPEPVFKYYQLKRLAMP
jgi:uncharacterized protein (TIGR03790 family)